MAETIDAMQLKYVVITSVNRDDLRDGGAQHFIDCMQAVRSRRPGIIIEILVPDFRGRVDKALQCFDQGVPNVFNHNIETVPALYKQARPGADYHVSLGLLQTFKQRFPNVPTKSGIMLGLGETLEQTRQVLEDLREHDVEMLTVGQYLQPSRYHMPVSRYVTPEEFTELAHLAKRLGFSQVASGPLVRSSYHADQQWAGECIT